MQRFRRLVLGSVLLAACGAPEAGDSRSIEVGRVAEAAKVCAGANTVEGVDISEFQPNVDWNALKASGRQFVFIRASDGNYHDKKFDEHWTNAKAAGFIRAAYQFFEPTEDPIVQADFILSKIGGKVDPGDLPPMLDFEKSGTSAEPSAATTQAAMKAWVDHITAAIGRKPMIYSGYYYWTGASVGNPQGYGDCPFIVAAYPNSFASAQDHSYCPSIPDEWSKWTFWQYSSGAQADAPTVPGIGQSCDRDFFNGTLGELMALANGGGGPDWAASYVGQSWPLAGAAPIQLQVGVIQTGSIDLKNVGSKTWPAGVVKLSPIPRDQPSDLAGPTWLSSTRVSSTAGDVKPGEVGHFEWDFTPAKEGDFMPYFGLVAEGQAWFADSGGPADNVIQVNVHVAAAPPMGAGGSGQAGSAGQSAKGGAAGASGASSAGKGGATAGGAAQAGGSAGKGTAGAGGKATGAAGAAGSIGASIGGSAGAPGGTVDEAAPSNTSGCGCRVPGDVRGESRPSAPAPRPSLVVLGLAGLAIVLRKRSAKRS